VRYVPLLLFCGCLGTLGDENDEGQPGSVDVGRVTVHRLNRVEYANTIRDLLGTTTPVWEDFPTDDRGYGFDNIADVLSLSPLHLELYQRAAETLAAEALAPGRVAGAETTFEAETVGSTAGTAYLGTWVLTTNGAITSTFDATSAGDYRVVVRAFGQQAGPAPVQMAIEVTGAPTQTFTVTATDFVDQEAFFPLEAGAKTVSVRFLNDFYDAGTMADRNLVVDWFKVAGPVEPNPLRARLVICDPAEAGDEPCLRTVLGAFARRAFRRPVAASEIDALTALAMTPVDEGQGFDAGLSLALQAVLTSPYFLYRIEIDPDPASMTAHPLSPHELASRLSYFLWSSMPDDALLDAADASELYSDEQLRAQVRRMLADEKAAALVDNFAGQWLFTRALDDHVPDYATFPEYDDELRESMREETVRFFRELLAGDQDVSQVLLADFTWVNARLAAHYGLSLEPPLGEREWRRISLADVPRRGILGQGSVLTVTSFPTRTSPVKRGKWVLEQILCSGPPPPPPGVEGLVEEDVPSGSLREQLEQHRSNPTCAACHSVMDPIGFSLESFDGIGRFRTEDTGGFPIDDSGMLEDGTRFAGETQLVELLAADPRFARCVAEKMYVYALGRGPEDEAQDHIEDLSETLAAAGERTLADLIELVTLHESFRMRRGER
jgi:hypothetical protein